MALQLSPHMTVMQNAVQKASRRLVRDFAEVEQLQVSVKGPGDFVSQADIRSEQTIRTELERARPGYAFMLEEGGMVGSPNWCISVALERRTDTGSEIVAGCVYNPVNDEMFWAEKGAGAFLNERRLRVSGRKDMKDALLATGIPFASVSAPRRLAFARTLGTLMPVVAGIRRFGAAALDLAWVAAGRYDGYWELGPKPWDVAAGALIVREAGGYATDTMGGELVMDPAGIDIVAANSHLHPKLLEVVAEGVAASRAA
jgi:myo-inositol-1(or 4)-monophosphatase